jgi:hypothetical protein
MYSVKYQIRAHCLVSLSCYEFSSRLSTAPAGEPGLGTAPGLFPTTNSLKLELLGSLTLDDLIDAFQGCQVALFYGGNFYNSIPAQQLLTAKMRRHTSHIAAENGSASPYTRSVKWGQASC